MDPEQLLYTVKKDVRSLLISSKHGLSPEQLGKDYHKMLGQPIPLRALGFRSVLEMVKEMTDVVRIDYDLSDVVVLKAIGDETTRGIEELVSKQRRHKPKFKSKSGDMGLFSSRTRHHQHSFVLPRRGNTPPPLLAHLRSQLRQLLIHGPIGLSDLERSYAVRFGRPLVVTHYGFYSIAEMVAAASDMITVNRTRMGSQLILKTKISPDKQTHSGTAAFHTHSSAFPSVSTSSAELSNIQPEAQQEPKSTAAIKIQEIEPTSITMQEKLFKPSVSKLEEEFRKVVIESGDAGTVSQELKEKLRKVVSEYNQGMAICDLPTAYKKMYGEDLPLAQCGFLNVTEMVEVLSDTFCVQPSTEEGKKVLLIMELKPNDQPAVSPSPTTEGHYFSCSELAWECLDDSESMDTLESNADIIVTKKTIYQTVDTFPLVGLSHGSMVPLDALQRQKLKPPTRRRERELVPVLVERIESPSHFYIRFVEDQEARTLENMMFEMRSCYSYPEVGERYRLPDAYVQPGQVCCVSPGDVWFYRVVIHRLLNGTEVEVYYVDFGDFTVVSRNRLKFLKSCYAELPAQAVPSVLVGVKPYRGIWSKEATSSFQKFCSDRTLVAIIHSYQHNFLMLYLCDTHTEEDHYIHCTLQDEGHAVACSSSNTLVLQKINPVTLFLGDDQLEEVREKNLTQQHQTDASILHSQISTDGVQKQQHSQDIALLDLPELELIDMAQDENSNSYVRLLNNDPADFVNWDEGWTGIEEESKLLHSGQEENAKNALLSLVPPLKPDAETQPALENMNLKPTLTPHMLSDPIPGLIPSYSQHTETSGELFQPLASNLMFSMFSSRDRLAQRALYLRHMSPLMLSPSARMAAGSSLLRWYTQQV